MNDIKTTVLLGHYGSGKSEIALNLAIKESEKKNKVTLIDLDIANPYFRSRERQIFLEEKGITVISNAYGYDISADLPALSPKINSYILQEESKTIIDAGGNDTGARVLNQFRETLEAAMANFLIVVNTLRPETDSQEKIIKMIHEIENEIGFHINGLINNTNLLRETNISHIENGCKLLNKVSKKTGIPVIFNSREMNLVHNTSKFCEKIFPIRLYLRPDWLDV